jgi:multidrug efflux pump subunit AcrA (membrane-fusion protein)
MDQGQSAEQAWAAFTGAQQASSFCRAWLDVLVGRIGAVSRAMVLLADERGIFVPAATWPEGRRDYADFSAIAQRVLTERLPSSAPVASATTDTPERRVLAAMPVEVRSRLVGAVVLDLALRDGHPVSEVYREIQWAAGWLGSLTADSPSERQAEALVAAQVALESMRELSRQEGVREAALAFVHFLSSRYAAQRVALALPAGHGLRMVAISGSAWFDRRSRENDALENALEEAFDQRATIVVPPLPGRRRVLSVALVDLLGSEKTGCVIVLGGRTAQGAGAVLLQREASTPFTAAEIVQLEGIVAWVGPVLELMHRDSRWVSGRLRGLLGSTVRRLRDPRRPALAFALGAAAAAVGALALWPVTYRVTANAVIEGAREITVAAPFDGFVARSLRRAGERVRAGELLAELDDRPLKLEQARWRAEREQQDRRFRDALARHDRAAAGIAAAGAAQADAQLQLADYRIGRAGLRAESDAVVIRGDLSQMLGAPVERGRELFRLAPLDAYRVILKVDERDVRWVREGSEGMLALASITGEVIRFRVVNVSVAEPADGINTFRVEGAIESPEPLRVRPGMQGIGKIEIEPRSLLWIWTRRSREWLQLQLFRWWP